jgi:membrane protease YdiL (CAAX protease family)
MNFIFNILSLSFLSISVHFIGYYIVNKSDDGLIINLTIFTVLGITSIIISLSLINKYVYTSKLPSLNSTQFKLDASRVFFWIFLSLAFCFIAFVSTFLFIGKNIYITQTPFLYSLYFSFISALFPGVVEEICYRWFLYGRLKKTTNKFLAATVVGIIFSLLHFNQVNTFESKVLLLYAGISVTYLFCALYESTGSIWPCAILHTAWDMFSINTLVHVQFASKLEPVKAYQLIVITLQDSNILMSGGDFGFESNISSITLYLLAAISLIMYQRSSISKQRNIPQTE